KLKADVARMNRLVEQLLDVAKLDSVALNVSDTVDLNAVAAAVVSLMAPWTIARQRSLAFAGCNEPAEVRGNPHAIEDALRNLIENAVAHAPLGTEVTVEIDQRRRMSVVDRGPGVPAVHQERIFERFWRGEGSQVEGAGLGL